MEGREQSIARTRTWNATDGMECIPMSHQYHVAEEPRDVDAKRHVGDDLTGERSGLTTPAPGWVAANLFNNVPFSLAISVCIDGLQQLQNEWGQPQTYEERRGRLCDGLQDYAQRAARSLRPSFLQQVARRHQAAERRASVPPSPSNLNRNCACHNTPWLPCAHQPLASTRVWTLKLNYCRHSSRGRSGPASTALD